MKSVAGIILILLGLSIAIGLNIFSLIIPIFLVYIGVKLVRNSRGRNINIRRF